MEESKQLQASSSAYQKQYLHEGWEFKQVGNESVYPVSQVPGTVHQDLLALGMIPDPYYRDNLWTIQWVENGSFLYYLTFNVSEEILAMNTINLVFEGLDTHATVYLVNENDEREVILDAHNMFRTYSVYIKDKLKVENKMVIYFKSAVQYDKEQAEKDLPLVIPISYPDDPKRMYSRKAAYQYGWDWGPRIVTCGIWKPVYIEAYNAGKINDIHVKTQDELTEKATVTVSVNMTFHQATQYHIFYLSVLLKDNGITFSHEFRSNGEANQVEEISIPIHEPKLWWARNLGDPYLYSLEIKLVTKDGDMIAEGNKRFGIRTVELVQEKDEVGTSFYFKLNGRPVFLKGANYIPPDMLMPRVTQKVYEDTLQHAIDANYNALRVWGGGNYENDIFYDLCDEKGIIIWQDFMFANTMFPGNEDFFANVQEEIVQNSKRLRNHPCILIWCGNNEIYEGWVNWGWQDSLTDQQKEEVFSWYNHIFNEIIPGVLADVDPSRPYWSTSPLYGWGHLESLAVGDSHYWGVFAGLLDIEYYNTHFGKFNTEFGMQGMPPMTSIKKFSLPEDWAFDSSVMLTHERHPNQYGNLQHYLDLYYKPQKDFQMTVYVAGVLQSYAMKTAIESHRRNKPRSMGTLMWQLNDVWPVTSWSAVDYYGSWKAVHYQSKRLFEDLFVCAFRNEDVVEVYLVSEEKFRVSGNLSIKVFDFDGNTLFEHFELASIEENGSKLVFSFSISSSLPPDANLNSAFISLEFKSGHDLRSYSNINYFSRPIDLQLKKPQFGMTFHGREIFLATDTLAKDVYLHFEEEEARLRDNYFDLEPGVTKVVRVLGEELDMQFVQNNVKIVSLYDSYQGVEEVKVNEGKINEGQEGGEVKTD